jgi:hypothetical protein
MSSLLTVEQKVDSYDDGLPTLVSSDAKGLPPLVQLARLGRIPPYNRRTTVAYHLQGHRWGPPDMTNLRQPGQCYLILVEIMCILCIDIMSSSSVFLIAV